MAFSEWNRSNRSRQNFYCLWRVVNMHINVAPATLKKQFTNLAELKPTFLLLTLQKTDFHGFEAIQIIHCRGNHWIVAAMHTMLLQSNGVWFSLPFHWWNNSQATCTGYLEKLTMTSSREVALGRMAPVTMEFLPLPQVHHLPTAAYQVISINKRWESHCKMLWERSFNYVSMLWL